MDNFRHWRQHHQDQLEIEDKDDDQDDSVRQLQRTPRFGIVRRVLPPVTLGRGGLVVVGGGMVGGWGWHGGAVMSHDYMGNVSRREE